MRTDIRTDMTKLILAFLKFANAPKSYIDGRTFGKYGVQEMRETHSFVG